MTKIKKEELNGQDLFIISKKEISLTAIITVVTTIVLVAGSYFTLQTNVSTHVDNEDVHMTYEKKVQAFVPRGEYNDLKMQINKMEQSLDRIENILLTRTINN